MPWGVASLVARARSPPKKHMAPLNMVASKNPPYLSTNTPVDGGPIRLPKELMDIPIPM